VKLGSNQSPLCFFFPPFIPGISRNIRYISLLFIYKTCFQREYGVKKLPNGLVEVSVLQEHHVKRFLLDILITFLRKFYPTPGSSHTSWIHCNELHNMYTHMSHRGSETKLCTHNFFHLLYLSRFIITFIIQVISIFWCVCPSDANIVLLGSSSLGALVPNFLLPHWV